MMKRLFLVCACIVLLGIYAYANGSQEEVVTKTQEKDGNSFQAGDISVDCSIEGDRLMITLSAPTAGWIAIGFQPTSMMKDANIIIGAVEDGKLIVEDHFGNSAFAHRPDTELGGSRDVEAGSGSEEGGETTFTFAIPLDSGDSYDNVLRSGETIKIILAYGKSDSFKAKHRYRLSAELTVE